jgi:reactive chlorine resistance protein C
MNTIINEPTIGSQNPTDRQIASSYRSAFSSHAEKLGSFILRYGLVAILLYFGAYKFTTEEAQGIAPLVAHSPFFNWLQALLGTQAISNVIGSSEIVIALLIATRPFSARLSSIGSVLAVGTFLATLSFLVTTPGVWHYAAGFPVPVPNLVGAFLIKDLFLLGASVWTAGEAAKAAGYHA